ncbi:maleylpyruvate isomerase N-terminal domain-containing protein [Kribbella sp. NBC_00889]|uniref:maleylpyruvate isomerase N-terminal domain-containing protein n=1 Tax=Kribbella sp. NBC_00889 TaxID=2975974 RepID=UPI003866AFF3|nr:maleylpyruvate isomerase N-terminal domain-containing protein [Kribbella sp. NBC_00889]
MSALLAEQIGRADRPRCKVHRDAEIQVWHDLLASIEGSDWQRRTVCDKWDVADIAGHLIGYVHDILLARDLWMDRDDVCQALGRSFDAGPYAEEIVGQVMYDVVDGPFWGHRPTVVLEFTGQGGGTYRLGRDEPVGRAAVDAVGYMRTLSGRGDAPVVSGDAAAVDAVSSCRVPF